MFTTIEKLITARNLRPKKKEGFLKVISIFSFFIIPDKSANANSMNLNIQSMKPGFTVKILSLPTFEKRNLKSYFFIDIF